MRPITHSAREVAAGLGCTERWLVEQARDGKIPARRIAKQWRFTQQDCAEIVDLFANGFQKQQSESAARPAGLTAQSRRRLGRGDRQQSLKTSGPCHGPDFPNTQSQKGGSNL